MNETRPTTIGLFVEGLDVFYETGVYKGLKDYLAAEGVNLVCYCGTTLRASPDSESLFEKQIVHHLAGPEVVDGLVTTAIVGTHATRERLDAFLGGFGDRPIVSVGSVRPSIPCVEVDNARGMEMLLAHLLDHHKVKRWLFMHGGKDNPDAEARYQAYERFFTGRGLDPHDHILLYGQFSHSQAQEEMAKFLSDPLARVDAVVCANDDMALGVIYALEEHGLNVPQDTTVVGFDGYELARNHMPGVTTVVQPLEQLGRKAGEIVLHMVRRQEYDRHSVVEPWIEINHSCGCFGEEMPTSESDVAGRGAAAKDVDAHQAVHRIREILAGGLEDCASGAEIRRWSAALLDGLRDRQPFLRALDTAVRRTTRAGHSPDRWAQCLVKISECLAAVPQSHEAFRDHETSIKAGLVYVANAVRRYLATSSFFHSAHADALRGFQAELAHSADYDGIAASMGRFVPLLPVDECHLAVFDDVESALPDTRVLLSYRRGERDEPGEIVRQGSCTDVLASVVRRQGPAAFVVEQLKNFPEDLGFLVLRSDHHDTNIFTALREAVTNGMRGSFLLGRVRKQAEELADANRELLRLRAKEQEYLSAIKGDLQLARQIQSDFLPQNLPELAGWDLAVHFQPAREVSGDFYDVFLLPDNRTGIVVADVCGKGVGAAIFMALVRSLIRALGGQTVSGDPIETVRFLNDYIMRNHHQDGPYMFATVFYGVLDTDSGVLRYVNAGHPAPVVAAEGHVERHLKRTGPAVGVDLDARYEAADDRLALGDVLFAYTDGVTETQNGHGVLMGRQTLYTVLERSLMTPASLIDSVRREILSHREEQSQSDDITMVVLKRI